MKIYVFFLIFFCALPATPAQTFERDFTLAENASVRVVNLYGRVNVVVEKPENSEKFEESEQTQQTIEAKQEIAETHKASLSTQNVKETDLRIENSGNRLDITVAPADQKARIDLTLKIPMGARLKIETANGEVRVDGAVESAEIKTETGTIAVNVPLGDVRYDFVWTDSRPRFLSDVELEEADEKAGGKFVVNGRIGEKEKRKKGQEKEKTEGEAEKPKVTQSKSEDESDSKTSENPKDKNQKTANRKPQTVKLNFTTARGIILLNVPPNEVMSDLRERPLTEAAKAIVRSGDSLLTEAIRRASPKYFGEYAKTLPPRKSLPNFAQTQKLRNAPNSSVKKVLARVTDINNRAVADLTEQDFEIFESNESREILSVEPTTATFNLVLLVDVSGSVDTYVDFIRKTARNFVNSVNKNDKVALVIFNEDVKTLSTFTTDKGKLSESLDTFDAGGGTAYYDALAYVLAETLRPLKGERTAIVALTDGDDNRSFLPFDALLGSIQESGALVYPLYVPSGLIAATATNNVNASVDPLRARYDGLTTKATGEGERLAQISGGVYYPIRQLSELQKAYEDIAAQLRTAYTITFRSTLPETADKTTASPRLRVKVKKENSFVRLGAVIAVAQTETGAVNVK